MARVTVWVQKFQDRENLVLQWYCPITGRRKSLSAKTSDEKVADGKRADLEYRLNNELYQEPSRVTWMSFRESFAAEKLPGVRENTRCNYEQTFNDFESICNPRQMAAINERTISAFLAGLRRKKGRTGEPLEPSTCRVRLLLLHAALKWAEDQKLLPKCPKFPVVKVPKRRPQAVPLESFEKLILKATDEQMYAFLFCGWLAGLRRTEALILEWSETSKAPYLDFSRNRIILPAEYCKGNEDSWLPLDPALRQILEALPRHGRKVFRFIGPDGKPIGPAGVSRRIMVLAQRAGVKLSMRALRRGFGCRYAAKVPAQILQRLMRHSSIQTTVQFYTNVDEALERAVFGSNGFSNIPTDSFVQVRDFPDANSDHA